MHPMNVTHGPQYSRLRHHSRTWRRIKRIWKLEDLLHERTLSKIFFILRICAFVLDSFISPFPLLHISFSLFSNLSFFLISTISSLLFVLSIYEIVRYFRYINLYFSEIKKNNIVHPTSSRFKSPSFLKS